MILCKFYSSFLSTLEIQDQKKSAPHFQCISLTEYFCVQLFIYPAEFESWARPFFSHTFHHFGRSLSQCHQPIKTFIVLCTFLLDWPILCVAQHMRWSLSLSGHSKLLYWLSPIFVQRSWLLFSVFLRFQTTYFTSADSSLMLIVEHQLPRRDIQS